MSRNMSVSSTMTDFQSLFPYFPPSLQPFLSLQYPLSTPSPTSRTSSLFRNITPFSTTTTSTIGVSTLYGTGSRDVFFPITCAIGFTLLREICMRYVFASFGRWYLGESNAKDPRLRRRENRDNEYRVTRFAEQGWSFLYCTVFWTLGVFVLYQNPSPTSSQNLWATYPVLHLTALCKFYYLAQLGWWFHQIYVINTEKRRKDHWQMFGHHVLTIILITASYKANFTRVGVLIHCLMDFCDILLPAAKMLRYMKFSLPCDIAFVLFLLGWLLTRQIGLALVIKSTALEGPKYFSLKWDPLTGHYSSPWAYYGGFLTMEIILWCLATAWFYLAMKVAIRVVRGMGAEDSRSDGGGDEVESTDLDLEVDIDGEGEDRDEDGDTDGDTDGGDTSKTISDGFHVQTPDLQQLPELSINGGTTALEENGNGHGVYNDVRKRK